MDIMKMMGKVKEMQAKMAEVNENLQAITATGDAGAGMVKASVNGKKQLLSLEIDKDLCKPEDVEMLQDLIVAAINKALDNVEVHIKDELKKTTDGMLPPGFNLGF